MCVDRWDPDFYHYSAQIDGFVSQLFQESVENASPRPFLKPGAQNRYFFKGFQTKTDSFVRGLRLSQLLFFISFVAFMASLLHRLHELHVAMLAYTPFVSDHNSRRTKYCIPRNVKWWWCWWWWWWWLVGWLVGGWVGWLVEWGASKKTIYKNSRSTASAAVTCYIIYHISYIIYNI